MTHEAEVAQPLGTKTSCDTLACSYGTIELGRTGQARKEKLRHSLPVNFSSKYILGNSLDKRCQSLKDLSVLPFCVEAVRFSASMSEQTFQLKEDGEAAPENLYS